MKTSQRIPKAMVVITVVCIGLFHNIKDRSFVTKPLQEMTTKFNTFQNEGDTVKSNTGTFVSYTKSIIKSSFKQLISEL
jgi:hypothetical protein